MSEITHLDQSGGARMVDVGDKAVTRRRAVAEAVLTVGRDAIETIRGGGSPKGNVLETARLAGIMAAKRTADLIPLCHTLPLDGVAVEFEVLDDRIRVVASASTRAATGVEMEALTAAAIAGLTIYDMLKALTHEMTLGEVRLLAKSGGRSGEYRAPGHASKTSGLADGSG
jgi:cyclic pyranopterin phosphate synthase